MQHRLSNDSFSFIQSITLRTPGTAIREVRMGASRVMDPLQWQRPSFRLRTEGDAAELVFDRPDNWARFGFEIVGDVANGGPGSGAAPLGALHALAETPMHEVRQRLRQQSIVFLGTARSCAAALPASITKLQELGALFGRSQIHVFENDSSDSTGALLDQYAADGVLQAHREQGVAALMPLRTERLAYGRNHLLDKILRQGRGAADWDYVCWADLDGLVGARFSVDGFLSNFQLDPVWDAVFPLSWPLYYDIWALRESSVCAHDYVWDGQHRLPAMLNAGREIHAATQQLAPGRVAGWLPVTSAFGGFGLYKAAVVGRSRYQGLIDGREVCEHVPYHEGLCAAGARLYLNPRCITHIA